MWCRLITLTLVYVTGILLISLPSTSARLIDSSLIIAWVAGGLWWIRLVRVVRERIHGPVITDDHW